MPPNERQLADARLDEALRETGAPDPRAPCRERLRELKERDPGAYENAVRYFEETLVPSIASAGAEPLSAWLEYGRHLADLSASGRTVTVDASGRARPYDGSTAGDALVLHLPHRAAGRALLVGMPRELSDAQRATRDWLVSGRQKLRDAD